MTETPRQTVEPTRVGERLEQAALATFLGREDELSRCEQVLVGGDASVLFVHGIGGIGKSALLRALSARLAASGVPVLHFLGHEVEPTPEGFLASLGRKLDSDLTDLEGLCACLERMAAPCVVLAIDEYEGLRLLDAWLRRAFVPALPVKVRLLFVGRGRPLAAWTAAPGWDGLVRSLELGPLRAEPCRALVARHGLHGALVDRILSVAQGHPLALKLAALSVVARPDLPFSEVESRHVLAELSARYLSDVPHADQRAALSAAALLRRITRPLLAAMLGDAQADAAMARLTDMPFVEQATDGLSMHQSVRSALEAQLRSLDPARYQELRARAWGLLGKSLASASSRTRWQVTADVIYLLEHPEIREAFFPSDAVRFAVEPALPTDRATVLEVAARHGGDSEAQILEHWWQHVPGAFYVVRDERGRVRGFQALALDRELPPLLRENDPLLAQWHAHRVRSFDVERPVLYGRAMLSMDAGAGPSEERAGFFLDTKRAYLQHLDLAAIYTSDYGSAEWPLYHKLGFRSLPQLSIVASRGPIATALLSFGPGVLAWLSRLMDVQSESAGGAQVLPFALDRATRELLVDGERKALTRLEYGMLAHLFEHEGVVVTRDELLRAVWGQEHTGSNVVDAVVRTLRKKLGVHASAVQTVTGFGYKLRMP